MRRRASSPTPKPEAQGAAKEREAIMGAMKQELARSSKSLKFKTYDAPYFIAYQMKDVKQRGLTGKYGSIIGEDNERSRHVYAEVRVGDHSFDNYANVDNEAFRLNETSVDKRAPLDANSMALRGVLWRLTDQAYKKALSDYLTEKGGAVYAPEEVTKVPSFSKEKPATFRSASTPESFDEKSWRETIKEVTAQMVKAEGIVDSSMDVSQRSTVRYLATSEGTDIIDEQVVYAIHIEAYTRASDGMKLDNGRSYYARTASELPLGPGHQGRRGDHAR